MTVNLQRLIIIFLSATEFFQLQNSIVIGSNLQ